jgi:alpha-1,6-mannosyltransferase
MRSWPSVPSSLIPSRSVTARTLVLCGLATGGLHLAVYLAQRGVQRGPVATGGLSFGAIVVAYVLATGGLFCLYGLVLAVCRPGHVLTKPQRRLAIGLPVGFYLALLPASPSMSIDVYSYLAHGYVQATLGGSAYTVGARAVARTPFGRELATYGWRPVHPVSPYGPLITHLEHAIASASQDVAIQILLVKATAVVATTASAALVWMVLGWVRPDHQMFGTVLFLWNPMLAWELAGEGHNDAVMILFVMLTLALTIRHHHVAALVATALAVLTKYLPLMLAPLVATYAWRTSPDRRLLLSHAVAGSLLAVGLVIALYAPLWAGLETFSGVRLNGAPGLTGSTPTMVLEMLERMAPAVRWHGLMWTLMVAGLGACVAWQARSVLDAFTLLRAAATVWLVYTLVLSTTFWPWYATTVVALLALVPERPFVVLAVVVSICSRLAAPLPMLYVHELIPRPIFLGSVWVIAVGLPLVALSICTRILWRQQRGAYGGSRAIPLNCGGRPASGPGTSMLNRLEGP